LNDPCRRRKRNRIVFEWRCDLKFNFQYAGPAAVCEGSKPTSIERRKSRCWRPLVDQVIAIPHVFITGKAEEMIDDATAGYGELDLFRSHTRILTDDTEAKTRIGFLNG